MSESDDNSDVRQNLVEEAAKFLVNPSVASHAVDNKKAFLRKKGLSEAEIDAAFARASTLAPPRAGGGGGVVPVSYPLPIPVHAVQPPLWVRVRDVMNFVLILTGASYGAFYLYKRYLAPLITGRREKSVEESMIELQHSVVTVLKEVQSTLASLEHTLSTQSTRIQTLSNKDGTAKQLEELKTELTSVKGLLINRRTFPSAPSMSPSIPSWQRTKAPEKPVDAAADAAAPVLDTVPAAKVDQPEFAATSEKNAVVTVSSEGGDSENGLSREDSFSLASAENGGSNDSLPDSEEELSHNVVDPVK